MDFTTIGSIGAYTRSLKMQALWTQKKDSGNFTQKNSLYGNGQIPKDPVIQQLEALQDNSDMDLAAIYNKLNSGKKLTIQELEYLKEKDPAAYQKSKEVEAERANFEREFKKCRTKEDFQRLKTMHMSTALAIANAIANDPAIPKGAKMGLLLHENAKVNAVADSAHKFIASGRYDKLPTEAELKEEAKLEEQLRQEEARQDEIRQDEVGQEEIRQDEVGQGEVGHKPESGQGEGTVSGSFDKTDDVLPGRTESAEGSGAAPMSGSKAPEKASSFSREAYVKSAYKEVMALADQESSPMDSRKARFKKA